MVVNRYDGEGKPVLDHLVVDELSVGEIAGFLCLGGETELLIFNGAITVTKSYHDVDTQAGAGTDNLDTISGGSTGSLLILRAENDARDVVVRDAGASGGNIQLAGGASFVMNSIYDTIWFIRTADHWLEMSRSDNG